MPLRSFTDRDGADWRVWSVVPAPNAAITLDEEFQGGWLCFERMDGEDRRRLPLGDAPAGWDALPDERLDLLRRVAPTVAHPVLESDERGGSGHRSLEDEARSRPSGPKSAIGGLDDALS